MSSKTVLLHHTHRSYSTVAEREVRGFRAVNHHSDDVAIAEALGPELSAIITRTEHFQTDPTYFEKLRDEVEARGGTFNEHTNHVTFQLPGNAPHAIVNGIEASVRRDTAHFTLVGLPLDAKEELYNLTLDELCEVSERVNGFTAAAHPFLPGFEIPRNIFEQFYETARDNPDIDSALNYTTGYWWPINKVAQGSWRMGPSVNEYAEMYDASLVPELDLHVTVPPRGQGIGLYRDGGIIDDLWANDDLPPTEQLLDVDVISNRPGREGLGFVQFLQTYPDMANMIFDAYDRGFNKVLPFEAEEFEAIRAKSYESLRSIPAEPPTYRPSTQTG